MISDAVQKWTVVIVIFLGAVHPQMPMMPMGFGYGPMMMPAPMPIAIPMGIQIPYAESTTTTTTTAAPNIYGGEDCNNNQQQSGNSIAVQMPVPQFVQIAIPSFVPENCRQENNKNGNRNKNCPPCPPCSCNPCTPSFFSFCSPCHQECRCKNGKENPVPQKPDPPKPIPGPAYPMPIPMAAPPPVVIVPFPPQFAPPPCDKRPYDNDCEQPPQDSDCDSRPHTKSCSEESKEESSCETSRNRKRSHRHRSKTRKKKKRLDIYRRNMGFRSKGPRNDELVKPMLTYVSRNGDVVMKRFLNNNEAHTLLGEGEPFNKVRMISSEGSNNNRRRLVLRPSYRRRQKLGISQLMQNQGRKQLLFKPPENKKISNLSVSFQISK